MPSCATCPRAPCFSRGVGLNDLQRSLRTSTILWLFLFTAMVQLMGRRAGKPSEMLHEAAEHATAQPVTTGLRSFQHLGKGWGQKQNELESKGAEGEISANRKVWLPGKEIFWVMAGKHLELFAVMCRCNAKRRRLQSCSAPIKHRREGMGIRSGTAQCKTGVKSFYPWLAKRQMKQSNVQVQELKVSGRRQKMVVRQR